MILNHGFAEHLECYEELGSRLAKENILAYGHDHGNVQSIRSLTHSLTLVKI